MQSFPLTPMIAATGVFVFLTLLVVVAIVIVKIRTKASLVSVFVGMAVFAVCFVIAMVTSSIAGLLVSDLLILTLLLSLRAGVVEELGRYLAFKVFLKKQDRIADALLYGLGHGGMEVVLVLGLSAVNTLVIGIMVNAGMYDLLAQDLDGLALATLEAQINGLAHTSVSLFALGGVERVWAVIAHVSFSVIVFCAVRQRRISYLFVAILLHFGLDCSTYLYHASILSIEVFELFLGGIALVIAGIAWIFGRRYITWSKEQALHAASPQAGG